MTLASRVSCLNREVFAAMARIENELLAARGSQLRYATPAFAISIS